MAGRKGGGAASDIPEQFARGALQRRPPFGDNPDVGARGTRTQQRILQAALEVFEEVGYHDCGVDRITAKAQCSRPSFYQYFSSKEDLFRHLSGDLARGLFDTTAQLEPVTPDADGWKALRTWVTANRELYDVYAPVFRVFSTAVAVDDAVASGAARVFARQATELAAKVDRRAFRVKRPEVVAAVLLNGVARAARFQEVVIGADGPDIDGDRLDDALADVLHRTFFGQLPGINVRGYVPMAKTRPSVSAPALTRATAGLPAPVGQAGRRTRNKLLDAGRQVFAARGYHDARVDDIVELAETSHGTFYRYFENKQVLFRILAARSGRRVVAVVEDLPAAAADPSGGGDTKALRQWLRSYLATYATEGPVIRAWVEAMWSDEDLRKASPPEVEALRRRMARFLAPREFGDVDADALVLMAVLDRSEPVLDAGATDPAVVDAFTRVFERGLLPTP
ncbi:MAG: regulatory protein TetR [Actinomycetia bacterium]|nr:regulatory protein TetR [Actinomycetes bacterium]